MPQKLKRKFQHAARWEWWQFFYVVLSLSWLLSPSWNHHFSSKVTYISQFEDPGQPWSWLYRTCDVLGSLLLATGVWLILKKRSESKLSLACRASIVLLAIVAVGSLIDDFFPSACHGQGFCLVSSGLSMVVHASESIITSGSLVALNVIWTLKRLPWARTVLVVQLVWSVVFLLAQFTTTPKLAAIQFMYQLVVTLWIATLVPYLAGWRPRADRKYLRTVIHLIAGWIFFGGFIAVAASIRNIGEISHRSAAYFGDNTAWLSQHGIAVGIILMYISRHLWRGEYRAWQLVSILLWLETLKYAVLTPDSELVLLYGMTSAVLFVLRGSFDRLTSVESLRDRLKKLGWVALAFVFAVLLGIVAFRLKHHHDIDSLRINFGQFSSHFFLLDEVNDLGPLPKRLLGQVLNAAGIALLLTIVVSLFRPRRPLLKPAGRQERHEMLEYLKLHSNSTEDYFKYWPQPKNYWKNSAGTAIIAYRVVGGVAFALADPVAAASERPVALRQFQEYCRQHGWRACFLMVADERRKTYKQSGYKLLRIGASAEIDVERFASKTSRNKWWRWVLNKAKRQGWQYQPIEPPHDQHLISELRRVSDAWLKRQNHTERGFALGYFDEHYLQQCRLHLLRGEGRIIAFANELPTYNGLKASTIDLMRFLPECDHAMPALLANIIRQLHDEGDKKTFDLGFVPLASPAGRGEQITRTLGQLLISEAVSAQGLEQFKNKFDPQWADNYIAFDGDWIDLINISRQIDPLLEV